MLSLLNKMGQANTSRAKTGLPAPEHVFPRTYRRDARARRVVNGFLLVIAGLFLFLTLVQVAHGGSLRDLIVVDLVVAAWVAWIGSGYNKRVILHQDTIEVVGWFTAAS